MTVQGRGRRPKRSSVALVAVFVATMLLPSTPAGAGEEGVPADPEQSIEEFEANQKRQAELAAELDALAISQEQLISAIEDLNDNLDLQQQQLDEAQRNLANRVVEAQRAEERHEKKVLELAELQARLDEMVVDAFINPPSTSALSSLLESDSPNDAETKDVLRGSKIDFDVDLIERVERAKAELGILAEQAADAEVQATDARDDQVAAIADLDDALLQHQVFMSEVQARISADFLEATAIADANSDLAANLVAEAQRLASRLAGLPNRGGVETVVVEGIRVHKMIAPQLQLMLDAAKNDGIILGGGGYRSTEEQIALRRAHCGEAGVFTAPASSCSPPTAKPGSSLHEIGLAIDFTVNGQIIGSRSQKEFLWMAEHAHEYGFTNLPSEPWHWSVNGN